MTVSHRDRALEALAPASAQPSEPLGPLPAAEADFRFECLTDFLGARFPQAEPLLGDPGCILLAVGSLLLVYGADGSGKSTWTIDGIAHMAAGVPWLGIPVPRPVRFCIVENEGPPSLFQAKLAAKDATWEGPDWRDNVHVFTGPWGEFSFADAAARGVLASYCDHHEIDVVAANPTLGLGAAGSGRPEETQRFVDWLVECGLKTMRGFWLLHHENKAGQISGDWGRHPDTRVQLQRDGDRPRTKLDWVKTRWASLPVDGISKTCLLDWVPETQGYTVVDVETIGASDEELRSRVDEFLRTHPLASTTTVERSVSGSNDRIRTLLKGGRYDSVPGSRGATLWLLDDDPAETSAAEAAG